MGFYPGNSPKRRRGKMWFTGGVEPGLRAESLPELGMGEQRRQMQEAMQHPTPSLGVFTVAAPLIAAPCQHIPHVAAPNGCAGIARTNRPRVADLKHLLIRSDFFRDLPVMRQFRPPCNSQHLRNRLHIFHPADDSMYR